MVTMDRDATPLETFHRTVQAAGDTQACVSALRTCLGGMHVTYHLTRTVAGAVDSPFVRTTYPDAWVSAYLLRGYVAVDPIIRAGLSMALPFDWSELEFGEETVPFLRDAAAHGIGANGYSIPIIDKIGRRALFSINAALDDDAWHDFLDTSRADLAELAHMVHRKAVRELYGEDEPPQLTPREREVLFWTAKGKDAKAVGMMLGVSEHTVKDYLRTIRHKCDCVTTAQAIAVAMRYRLLSDD